MYDQQIIQSLDGADDHGEKIKYNSSLRQKFFYPSMLDTPLAPSEI